MITEPESVQRFEPISLAAVDQPVRRLHPREGAFLATGIRLTMAGRIKVGRLWLAFTAEQVFDGHEFS